MFKLNKEKEYLLTEKYNFVKHKRNFDDSYYYDYEKCLSIEGFYYDDKKNRSGKVSALSFSFKNQDIIYDLIKDDVIIKVEVPKKISERKRLENRIIELENKIKELENKNEI